MYRLYWVDITNRTVRISSLFTRCNNIRTSLLINARTSREALSQALSRYSKVDLSNIFGEFCDKSR